MVGKLGVGLQMTLEQEDRDGIRARHLGSQVRTQRTPLPGRCPKRAPLGSASRACTIQIPAFASDNVSWRSGPGKVSRRVHVGLDEHLWGSVGARAELWVPVAEEEMRRAP